jgi:rhomboid protease GluP
MLGKCPSCQSLTVPGSDGRCPKCGYALQDAATTGSPSSGRDTTDVTVHPSKRTESSSNQELFAASGRAADSSGTPQYYLASDPSRSDAIYQSAIAGIPPDAVAMDRFRQNVLRLTPHTYVTRVLVAANVLVFVVMVLSGVSPLMPRVDQLVDWGANFGPSTINGQWWRLVTCMFLHVGLIHLAFNMWVLWQIGGLVERLLGNTGLLVAYMISGVGGSLVSLAWHPHVVSAGASGAVFGLFGALLGFLVFSRRSIPMRALRALAQSSIMFVLFNVAFGLAVPAIDMAAHLGGLATGFLCGLGLSQPLDESTGRRRLLRNVLVAVIGSGLLAGATQLLPQPGMVQGENTIQQVEQQLLAEMRTAVERHQRGELSDQEFGQWLESQLPRWSALRERVEQLADTGPEQQRKALAASARQLQLREIQISNQAAALKGGQ